MVNLVEASRLLWCPGIAQLQGKPKLGMQEWLVTATYAPTVGGHALLLTGIDKQLALQAFAGDINRTATAASETLRNISSLAAVPKSLGWPYIKLYYSSLFYAHSLLRIWGRSASYLKTSDLLKLRQSVAAYGLAPPFKIQTSQYLAVLDVAAPCIELHADKGGGGSHEAVWRELVHCLERLEAIVPNSGFLSKDVVAVSEALILARNLLSNSGANLGWMSEVRNAINYRQAEGIWYPYSSRQSSAELCVRVDAILAGGIALDDVLKANGSTLQRFGAACAFVILLARATLNDIDEIGGAKTFVKFGQRRFEDAIAG